jgi:hypothetical protein
MKIFISWAGQDAKNIGLAIKAALIDTLCFEKNDIYISADDIECSTRFDAAGKIRDYAYAIFLLSDEKLFSHCINLEYKNFCFCRTDDYIAKHSYLVSTKTTRIESLGATEFFLPKKGERNHVPFTKEGIKKLYEHIAKTFSKTTNDANFNKVFWTGRLSKISKQKTAEPQNNEEEKKQEVDQDKQIAQTQQLAQTDSLDLQSTVTMLEKFFKDSNRNDRIIWSKKLIEDIKVRFANDGLYDEEKVFSNVLRCFESAINKCYIISASVGDTVKKEIVAGGFSEAVADFIIDCIMKVNCVYPK